MAKTCQSKDCEEKATNKGVVVPDPENDSEKKVDLCDKCKRIVERHQTFSNRKSGLFVNRFD